MHALLIPPNLEEAKGNNFDAIRLAMALAVVGSHSFPLYFGNKDWEPVRALLNGSTDGGNLAVMVFFIVSGFLITHSYLKSRSLWSFLSKRIRRIYPGFIVAVVICSVLVVPLYATDLTVTLSDILTIAIATPLLHTYFPPSNAFGGNPNPHAINDSLWTIPFEFWCYIGVAALGLLGLLRYRRLLLFVIVAALLARVCLDVLEKRPWLGPIGDVFGSPYDWTVFLPSFLLGVLFYNYRDRIPRSRLVLAAAVVVGTGTCWISNDLAILGLAPMLAYATFYVAFSTSMNLHGAARFGDFSYGTYLYAFTIQQMLVASLALSYPAYLGASLVCSLIAGVCSWYLVERWFLRHRARGPSSIRDQAEIVAP